MIPLEKGKRNIVRIRVDAPDSPMPFSILLMACGTRKGGTTKDDGSISFVFLPSDVANVTSEVQGEYGTLTVSDSDGEERVKSLLCFRAFDDASMYGENSRTVIIYAPKKFNAPSGDGGSQDLANYVTKKELKESSDKNNAYTDSKISDIGETIISEQDVTVTGEDGKPKTLTVKQAVQKVVTMQADVSQISKNEAAWSIKDDDDDGQPDGDTLYIKMKKTE